MWGRARAAADAALEQNIDVFERVGARVIGRAEPGGADFELRARAAFSIRMRGRGRVFGGAYALEVSTSETVVPTTRGLAARGRGLVRLRRITFRARRGDEAGDVLARRLETDTRLQDALAAVHFERIRVDPDGRAVIRHMGGSVVWVLFPPLVRTVPLVEEQARATVAALEAFAAVGQP